MIVRRQLPPASAQGHHESTWCTRRSPSAAYVSTRELGCRRRLNCVGVAKPVWGSLDGNPGRPTRDRRRWGPAQWRGRLGPQPLPCEGLGGGCDAQCCALGASQFRASLAR